MGDSPKSYYQVSFTGTQALAGILVVLGALALSFFFGAKAGFSRSRPAETAVAPPASAASAPGETEPLKPPPPASAPALPSPASGPIVAETFEDREAGLPETTKAPPLSEARPATAAPSRTVIAGSGAGAEAESPRDRSSTAPPPPREADSRADSKPPARPAGYYVQVLSTSSRAEATRWKDKLAAKKLKSAVSSVETKKGKLYRVRVGPYTDKDQARKVAAKISSEEKRQAWVAPAQ